MFSQFVSTKCALSISSTLAVRPNKHLLRLSDFYGTGSPSMEASCVPKSKNPIKLQLSQRTFRHAFSTKPDVNVRLRQSNCPVEF